MMPNLIDQLRALWRDSRQEVDARFRRTLPFADYVVDRREKARALGFGEGASIYDSALVIGDVSVGEQTWVGPGVVLDGSGGLSIGAYCSILGRCPDLQPRTVALGGLGRREGRSSEAPTAGSGDRCYIGPNTQLCVKGDPRSATAASSGAGQRRPVRICPAGQPGPPACAVPDRSRRITARNLMSDGARPTNFMRSFRGPSTASLTAPPPFSRGRPWSLPLLVLLLSCSRRAIMVRSA